MPPSLTKRGALSLSAVLVSAALITGCQSFSTTERAGPAEQDVATTASSASIVVLPPPAELPLPTIVLEPLPEPEDLYARLSASFVLPSADDASVEREIAWYARNQEYLSRVLGRGERYLHYIAGELERRGMPMDLALLPLVESAFDPFAYSHGRASGLWQIIPGTGRRLGLTQNWWFDGRRDVIESTRAALDYLEMLSAEFGGDWLLAVAGYNSGEGNVARALRRAAQAGEPQDFWGIRRYLPAETRTYVPRLIAIRELVAHPAAHSVVLPELVDAPFFALVETGGQIDMALAAELGGLELDGLYELNAGVNRWATAPDGPHRLLVPVAHAEGLAATLAELGDDERMRWSRHEIRPGETLSQLAEQYHTSADVLREANGLRGNVIRAGSYLLVPHSAASLEAYTQSASERAQRQINREHAGERRTHVVQSGESLWSISRALEVDLRELAAWNAMAPGDVLAVGRELVVWEGTSAATSAHATGVSAERQIRRVDYVVRRGDSLSRIAGRFRVTVAKLLEWNGGVATQKYLQPGQRLVMYVDVTEQST